MRNVPGRSTSALLPGAVRPSRVAQCHGSAGSKFRRIPGIGGALLFYSPDATRALGTILSFRARLPRISVSLPAVASLHFFPLGRLDRNGPGLVVFLVASGISCAAELHDVLASPDDPG